METQSEIESICNILESEDFEIAFLGLNKLLSTEFYDRYKTVKVRRISGDFLTIYEVVDLCNWTLEEDNIYNYGSDTRCALCKVISDLTKDIYTGLRFRENTDMFMIK